MTYEAWIWIAAVVLLVVVIALGIGKLMAYESRRRALREPLHPQRKRGDGYWVDAEGYDHDWKTDPPNGRRVVHSNPYGTDPKGPKRAA